MADNEQHDTERTEDPTQKRLDEALERGDVVKSQEVSTWFVIAGGALVLAAFSGSMSGGLSTTLRGLLANAHQIPVDGRRPDRDLPAGSSARCWPRSRSRSLRPGARRDRRQHDPASPGVVGRAAEAEASARFRRSPASSGCSPSQALVNFVKGLVKLVVIGAVMAALLWPQRDRLEGLVQTDHARHAGAHPLAVRSTCSAPWSRSCSSSPPPTTCSSTGNGTSGRRCRCAR